MNFEIINVFRDYDDEEDFLSEFAIRSKNITSVKNLILRRDYVPKVVNYMTTSMTERNIHTSK
jgi:hypothetical protein